MLCASGCCGSDDDDRVMAGAAVGSLAVDEGDRFSDLDLTFGIAGHVPVSTVLADWTSTLIHELAAVRLADLERGRTIYRVSVPTPAVAEDLFGWGVIYALHARACIERRRVWQAEHYVGAVRDHALSLACLRRGLRAVQARGYDDLPAETLARFAQTHVDTVAPESLRAALAASVSILVREAAEADLSSANVVAERIAELR
jgi:hypothetical protein